MSSKSPSIGGSWFNPSAERTLAPVGIDERQLVDWRARIERARIDLRRGDLARVVGALEPIVGASPASPEAAMLLAISMSISGRALIDAGHDNQGKRMLSRALDTSGPPLGSPMSDLEDVADLAAGYRYLGRPDVAVDLLVTAVAGAQTVAWRVRLELGRALRQFSRYDEAISHLSAALVEKPGEPFLLRERATCFEQIADLDRALQDLIDSVVAFLGRDRLIDAHEAAEHATVLSPNDPDALALFAHVLFKEGQVDAAAELIDRAAKSGPLSRMALWMHAMILLDQGQYEEAARTADLVLDVAPSDYGTVWIAVQAARALGADSRARAVLDAAIASEPGKSGLLQLRAELFADLGDLSAALEDYLSAADVDPTDAVALRGAAVINKKLGNMEGSFALYERALMQATDSISLRLDYAELLRIEGRVDEASEQLMKVLELEPGNAFALGTRGQIRIFRGDRYGAINDLREALRNDPDLRWARADLCRALLEDAQFAEAVAAVIDGPQDDDLSINLASLLITAEHVAEAVRVMQLAYDRAPTPKVVDALLAALYAAVDFAGVTRVGESNSESLSLRSKLLLAEGFRMQGHRKEAERWVQRCLDESPNDATALSIRGELRLAAGEQIQAEADFRKALDAAPERAYIKLQLGRVLHERGAYADAKELFADAYFHGNPGPDDDAAYADCLLKLGDAKQALDVAERGAERASQSAFAVGVLANVLRELGRYEEALLTVTHVIDTSDNGVLTGLRIERIENLRALGRLNEARAEAEEMTNADPQNSDAHVVLAGVLCDGLEFGSAVREVDLSLALVDDSIIQEFRCAILVRLGRYHEVIANLEPIRSTLADPWSTLYLARAHMRIHPPAPERVLVILTESLSGTQAITRQIIRGDALRFLGQSSAARLAFQDALSNLNNIAQPDSYELSLEGWAALKLGKLSAALRSLTRSLEMFADASVQFDLALVVLHTQDSERAESEYDRGLMMANRVSDQELRSAIIREALFDIKWSVEVEGTLVNDEPVERVVEMLAMTVQAPTVQATAG